MKFCTASAVCCRAAAACATSPLARAAAAATAWFAAAAVRSAARMRCDWALNESICCWYSFRSDRVRTTGLGSAPVSVSLFPSNVPDSVTIGRPNKLAEIVTFPALTAPVMDTAFWLMIPSLARIDVSSWPDRWLSGVLTSCSQYTPLLNFARYLPEISRWQLLKLRVQPR